MRMCEKYGNVITVHVETYHTYVLSLLGQETPDEYYIGLHVNPPSLVRSLRHFGIAENLRPRDKNLRNLTVTSRLKKIAYLVAINCEKQTNFHAFATFCLHILQFYARSFPTYFHTMKTRTVSAHVRRRLKKTPSFSFCQVQVDMYDIIVAKNSTVQNVVNPLRYSMHMERGDS